MNIFLVDGTYELFRQHFGRPGHKAEGLGEIDATRGVLTSTLALLEQGATHIGVATDHVVESFRNDLWPGYKSSVGIDPEIHAQFPLLEEALAAMGLVVWPMVDLEADDGLASAAAIASRDERVRQVAILTADKDLGQCVDGSRVVQVDRRKNLVLDEAAIAEKFGVGPSSIADYLALVGDTSDGFPGIPGWGAKSTAAVLRTFECIEHIPDDPSLWKSGVRGAPTLAARLAENRELALLFKNLATLRIDNDLLGNVDELQWTGPTPEFAALCERLDMRSFPARVEKLLA